MLKYGFSGVGLASCSLAGLTSFCRFLVDACGFLDSRWCQMEVCSFSDVNAFYLIFFLKLIALPLVFETLLFLF